MFVVNKLNQLLQSWHNPVMYICETMRYIITFTLDVKKVLVLEAIIQISWKSNNSHWTF